VLHIFILVTAGSLAFSSRCAFYVTRNRNLQH